MQSFLIIIPLILAIITGYALLNTFLRKEHIYAGEYILYSFFIGLFTIGFVLFLLLAVGAHLNMGWNILIPIFITLAAGFFGRKTFFQ